jgi:uncharacterized protein (TIGR02001 family)
MIKNKVLVAALASAFALPALAGDFTPSANVSLVSNYLYRGISQSGANPAIQGGFDLAHASGAYVGVWGSSISWLGDAAVATDAGLELDTYFGFKNAFATDFNYDVGFLRYNYPGDYAATATKADTNEIYGALGYKWITAKLSYSLGDLFGVANAKGSTYFDLSAAYPIADTGITLGAHYGKQTYKGSTADGFKLANQDPSYADYKVSVSKDFSGYVLALAYSNTNASAFYTSPQNKKLGKSTAVVSLSRTF